MPPEIRSLSWVSIFPPVCQERQGDPSLLQRRTTVRVLLDPDVITPWTGDSVTAGTVPVRCHPTTDTYQTRRVASCTGPTTTPSPTYSCRRPPGCAGGTRWCNSCTTSSCERQGTRTPSTCGSNTGCSSWTSGTWSKRSCVHSSVGGVRWAGRLGSDGTSHPTTFRVI